MNKIIHRILFKLGFCKKEAKQILEQAAAWGEYFYMCDRLGRILASKEHLNFKENIFAHVHYMSAYGFTAKNYHRFVHEHYPSLKDYLQNDAYSHPWITRSGMSVEEDKLAWETKATFLQYLANKL